MNVPGFTTEALEMVDSLLFAEGQINPLEGECGQKAKRKAQAKPRTPAEQQADKARSAARRGKPVGGDRSQAAQKAAKTRRKCKGGGAANPSSTSGSTVV